MDNYSSQADKEKDNKSVLSLRYFDKFIPGGQIMQNTPQHTTAAKMSKHATRRAQQRGVKHDAIEIISSHGDIEIDAGSGCYKLKASKDLLDGLVKTEDISRQLAEACKRLTLVVSGQSIVTCYRAKLH